MPPLTEAGRPNSGSDEASSILQKFTPPESSGASVERAPRDFSKRHGCNVTTTSMVFKQERSEPALDPHAHFPSCFLPSPQAHPQVTPSRRRSRAAVSPMGYGIEVVHDDIRVVQTCVKCVRLRKATVRNPLL